MKKEEHIKLCTHYPLNPGGNYMGWPWSLLVWIRHGDLVFHPSPHADDSFTQIPTCPCRNSESIYQVLTPALCKVPQSRPGRRPSGPWQCRVFAVLVCYEHTLHCWPTFRVLDLWLLARCVPRLKAIALMCPNLRGTRGIILCSSCQGPVLGLFLVFYRFMSASLWHLLLVLAAFNTLAIMASKSLRGWHAPSSNSGKHFWGDKQK